MITSVGALTDGELYDELQATAAAAGNGRFILCTGSMPAVDWMGAAALAGCSSVSVTQTKPPKAWLGTPAEAEHDLLSLTEPTVLFEGPARKASARESPQNTHKAHACTGHIKHTTPQGTHACQHTRPQKHCCPSLLRCEAHLVWCRSVPQECKRCGDARAGNGRA